MSAYNTGTVDVRPGSSTIKGNSTNFSTYVSAGDIFSLTSEDVYYEVADIVDATELTLTSRYSNSNYYTAIASNVASTVGATLTYSFTLDNTPVIRESLVVTASERFTDSSGGGTLSGSNGGSGTISYDDGSVSITLGTSLSATANVAASYNYGTLRSGMSYQIVTDYTTNYSIPELSSNDIGFNTIYTKAVRKIDSTIRSKLDRTRSNTDIDTGTETVDSFSDTSGDACVWHFLVKKAGPNLRAGTITAIWDASATTTEYMETSTLDIGDTSDLTLAVDINSNTVRLRATTTSDNWEVHVKRIVI